VQLLPAGKDERTLSAATLAHGIGFGSFAGCSAIFLTRSVGLTIAEVGTGTAIAGVVAVLVALLAGRAADKVGARDLLVVLSVAQAVCFAGYLVVSGFTAFLAVVCAFAAVDQGARVARNTVIAGMVAGRDRVALKAHLRSVSKLGISLGTVLSAIPLYLDNRPAYLTMIGANVAMASVTAVLVRRLPRSVPGPVAKPPAGWAALRDRPYMTVAVLCGLLATYRSLITIAMPLWITTRTGVPHTFVAALLVINTILGIALQVPASKRAGTAEAARRSARLGARLILPACAAFAVAAYLPVGVAMAVLAIGMIVLTAGELWTSVAAWSLSFELADSRIPGQYQGAFALGLSVETIAGPLLASGLVLGLGVPGWLAAGLLSATLGGALATVASRALKASRTLEPTLILTPADLAAMGIGGDATMRLATADPAMRRRDADVTVRLAYPEAATDLLSEPAKPRARQGAG
jgi:hypothetical protein